MQSDHQSQSQVHGTNSSDPKYESTELTTLKLEVALPKDTLEKDDESEEDEGDPNDRPEPTSPAAHSSMLIRQGWTTTQLICSNLLTLSLLIALLGAAYYWTLDEAGMSSWIIVKNGGTIDCSSCFSSELHLPLPASASSSTSSSSSSSPLPPSHTSHCPPSPLPSCPSCPACVECATTPTASAGPSTACPCPKPICACSNPLFPDSNMQSNLPSELEFCLEMPLPSPELLRSHNQFQGIIEKWGGACKDINAVLGADSIMYVRPYSLHERSYHHANILYPSSMLLPPPRSELCATIDALTHSLLMGERRPLDPRFRGISDPLFESHKHLSAFHPMGCSVRWFSSRELCALFGQYSNVMMLGDSLTRHVFQSTISILKDDWITGSLTETCVGAPASVPYEGSSAQTSLDMEQSTPPWFSMAVDPLRVNRDCRCDGSLSENHHCRHNWDDRMLLDSEYAYSCSSCHGDVSVGGASSAPTAERPFKFRYNVSPNRETNWVDIKATKGGVQYFIPSIACALSSSNRDPRPMMLYFSFGSHYQMNIQQAIDTGLGPIIDYLLDMLSVCAALPPAERRELVLIWGSIGTQAEQLDHAYPNQDAAHVEAFNAHVEAYIKGRIEADGISLPILNYFNLQMRGATSDGVHMLQEVNFIKVQYIADLMEKAIQQIKIAKKPIHTLTRG